MSRNLKFFLLTLSIFCVSNSAAALSFGTSDICPDFHTKNCLDHIRSLINQTNMEDAKEAAESQCFNEPKVSPAGRFSETLMLTNASGCFYLSSIETFLGNNVRAFEAKDRAKRISSFGCENGKNALCELMVGFLNTSVTELISEFYADVKRKNLKLMEGVKLRHVRTARSLPSAMKRHVTNTLKNHHKKVIRKTLTTCTNCNHVSRSYTRHALDVKMPKKTLDVGAYYSGGEVSVSVKIYDFRKNKIIFQKIYSTQDIKNRYENFGYNATATKELLAIKQIEEFKPARKFMFGLGATKMKNLTGGKEYDNRLVASIRSFERFNHRRSEFGLMATYQLTQKLANQKLGLDGEVEASEAQGANDTSGLQEDVSSENEGEDDPGYILTPYPTAFSLFAVYSHMLIGIGENYDGVRNGLHVGIGFYANSLYQALAARIGWDIYIAKSWVLTIGGVYVGESALMLPTEEELKIPAGKNAEFSFSYRI